MKLKSRLLASKRGLLQEHVVQLRCTDSSQQDYVESNDAAEAAVDAIAAAVATVATTKDDTQRLLNSHKQATVIDI